MKRVERLRGWLSLALRLVSVGIILGLPLTWYLSHHRDLTGIPLILFGAALWLSGLIEGWLLGRSGALSPTGRIFNSQGASQFHQTTKRASSSLLEELVPSGKLPSSQVLKQPKI